MGYFCVSRCLSWKIRATLPRCRGEEELVGSERCPGVKKETEKTIQPMTTPYTRGNSRKLKGVGQKFDVLLVFAAEERNECIIQLRPRVCVAQKARLRNSTFLRQVLRRSDGKSALTGS